ALLASEETLPRERVLRSLTRAWLTTEILVGALDEIAGEGRRTTAPLHRRPIRDGRFDPAETALVPPSTAPVRLEAARPLQLFRGMAAAVLVPAAADPPAPAPAEDASFLGREVA